MDNKLPKKSVGNLSEECLYRCRLPSGRRFGVSFRKKMAQLKRSSHKVLQRAFSYSVSVVKPVRTANVRPGSDTPGPTTRERPPVTPQPALDRPGRPGSTHPRVTGVQGRTPVVAEPEQHHVRRSPPSRPTRGNHLHGLFTNWLRGRLGTQGDLRHLVSCNEKQAYQLSGTLLHKTCTTGMGSPTSQQTGPHRNGQHYSDSLSLQTVGHSLNGTTSFNQGDSMLVCSPGDKGHGPSLPRPSQLCGRRLISLGNSGPHRVVSTPHSISDSSSVMVPPDDRPVCIDLQHKMPSVHVTSTGPASLCSGQSESVLGQSTSLCLPPTCPVKSSDAETQTSPILQNDPHFSQVGTHGLVQSSTGDGSGDSPVITFETRSTQTTKQENLSFQSEWTQSTRLRFIRRHLLYQGFSEQATNRILHKNRHSTEQLYEHYWNRFITWCKSGSHNPNNPSVGLIANFLCNHYDQYKCKPQVINGMKSCLAQTFKLCNLLDISHNVYLHAIVCNLRHGHPAVDFLLPKWDLNVVLRALLGPPYEPIWEISFKCLTQKTVFLLALATAARISELHSLSFARLSHNKSWSTVYLKPSLSFLAKNQVSTAASHHRCFTLKALSDFAGPDLPDRKLCPVRALRMYLAKTEVRRRRQGQRALFISVNPRRAVDISKAAVAQWLRQVIFDTHRAASPEAVTLAGARPHEVRALASSTAFARSLSLPSIMAACHWRGQSTFSSFYLRDVALESSEGFSLPPFVAATQIIRN